MTNSQVILSLLIIALLVSLYDVWQGWKQIQANAKRKARIAEIEELLSRDTFTWAHKCTKLSKDRSSIPNCFDYSGWFKAHLRGINNYRAQLKDELQCLKSGY